MFTNTFLSNEEVRQLIKHFGDGKSKLDYMRVSNELIGFDSALKSQQFEKMRRTHSQLNKIRADLMQVNIL
jgi:hypothetical protein